MPNVGDIVTYFPPAGEIKRWQLDNCSGNFWDLAEGIGCPGIVLRVNENEEEKEDQLVNLLVFVDGEISPRWVRNAPYGDPRKTAEGLRAYVTLDEKGMKRKGGVDMGTVEQRGSISQRRALGFWAEIGAEFGEYPGDDQNQAKTTGGYHPIDNTQPPPFEGDATPAYSENANGDVTQVQIK